MPGSDLVRKPLPPALATAARPGYHRLRKRVHLACFLIFVLLPFFNVVRFDIPRQRFYFAGYELWINEFGIIFFAMMFLMFVIIASSVLYGRVYCGYMCPQMIFSEASTGLQSWLRRKVNKRFSRQSAVRRNLMASTYFYAIAGAASVFLAFIFISYFVEPRDLWNRLRILDLQTAGGIAGATVTLITFLDFTLIRQKFCTSVCPYGYLQGLLGDKNTLLVHYRDEERACIQCKKCVRVCEMGIDIRDSPLQIECIHCGECIDACVDIMARFGREGLIHYTWGESGKVVENESAWYRKLGLRDAKRVIVLLVTALYLTGLLTALSMRRNVLVQISPVRATLYRVDAAGIVYNEFRVKIANRGHQRDRLRLSIADLPGGRVLFAPNPLELAAGEVTEARLEIAVPRFTGAQEVNHFRIVVDAVTARENDVFGETFLMPPERKQP
jgi:cytochrome c oxidase accessory protein FixG